MSWGFYGCALSISCEGTTFDAAVDERGIYTSMALATAYFLYLNTMMRITSIELVIVCVKWATSDTLSAVF